MKPTKSNFLAFSSLFILLTLFSNSATAQEGFRTKGQAVFFEVLGNGLTYSLNYDTRFNQSLKGLGGRAGIGHLAVDGTSLTSFPFLLNYLFGKDKHYFEVGAGATLLVASTSSDFGPVGSREKGSAFIGTMSFGYRLEPQEGGFLFRAGITPIFDRTSFFPFWPQISFGYAF